MKNLLLKFLMSKSGLILTPIITSGVVLAATKLAPLGIVLDESQQAHVTAWLTTTAVAIVSGLLLNKAGNAAVEIQVATGAEVDRVAGDNTVRAVKNAVLSPARRLPRAGGAGK